MQTSYSLEAYLKEEAKLKEQPVENLDSYVYMTIEVENAENVSNPGGNFAFTCTTCTVKAAYSSTDWKKKFRINNTRLNGKTQTTISVPEGYILQPSQKKINRKILNQVLKGKK